MKIPLPPVAVVADNADGIVLKQMVWLAEATGAVRLGRTVIAILLPVAAPQLPEETILL